MMFAKYFEYYTIVYLGGRFLWTRCSVQRQCRFFETQCSCERAQCSLLHVYAIPA